MMELTVNGQRRPVDADPDTPLLTVLRNELGLMGSKRGCAQEQCYACSVLIDGRTQPSCRLPIAHVDDLPITTVEDESLDQLREFFLAEQAGQCGYCVAGMIVATQGLLNRARRPNDAQIREALDTNLCRCGVYDRVRRAIRFRIGEPEEPIWEVRRQPPLGQARPIDSIPTAPISPSLQANPDLDSWIAVGEDVAEDVAEDETITVFTGKAELGQGIATAIARIAAEELSVDQARIRVVGPDTDRTPDEGVTSGSLSIETSGAAVRAAAATARELLLDRAVEQLGAGSRAELVLDDGRITAPGVDRQTSYWRLQGGRRFDAPVRPDAPSLGSTPPAAAPGDEPATDDPGPGGLGSRIDLGAKVAGRPSYVHDLRPPGTVHGRVVRPPRYESRLLAIDASPAAAMPGVVAVVRDGSFLGVVATGEQQADAAAAALADAASWSEAPLLPDPHEQLRSGPTADYHVVDGTPVDYEIESPATDPSGRFDHAAQYSKPFTLHGSLGPSAAMARFDDDRLTVWSHSQGVFVLRGSLSEVLNLSADHIRVIHGEGAGCYGHNGADDVALDAALLARAVPGRPVLVSWSRADEHRWEPYGPAMVVSLRADLAGDRITAFDSENWSYGHTTRARAKGDGSTNLLAGWHLAEPMDRSAPAPNPGRHVGAHRNSDPLYAIERRRVQTHLSQATDYRTSALRALGAFANVFALESFVDELAGLAGNDPVRFRLANLDDRRAAAVIEAAAELADWAEPRPVDRGRGIAFARYKNQQTYLAVVVDVAVDRSTGAVTIDRAAVAADAGRIVTADGMSNQLEGGCVQAASWTLKEQVRIEPDRVVSEDWDSYPILRFSESFPIRTVLLDRPDQPSVGCGEAAQGPMAAAIANAIHDAVGIRLRDLPLTPARVLDALADKAGG